MKRTPGAANHGSFPVELRRKWAEDESTDAETLEWLVADPDAGVRMLVAANDSTPTEGRRLLVLDPDPDVATVVHPDICAEVAHDPGTPPWALTRLAADTYGGVRWPVASNPHTPPDTLTTLARDPDDFVRDCVCTNPAAPAQALLLLARDPRQSRAAIERLRSMLEDESTPEAIQVEIALSLPGLE